MKRNSNLHALKGQYLFPEINLQKRRFLEKMPSADLISLGIGDTTEPLPQSISKALMDCSEALGTRQGYTGYGPEQGLKALRDKIASEIYLNIVESDDLFISDGAKCDLGRLQTLFGGDVSIALQDPAYPVYIDGSIIQGVKSILPMACTPENNFFPDLNRLQRTDLIYFCSPNNPTGAVANREQLTALVKFAIHNRSIIIFDSAYSNYIQDPDLPKSIYEIEGAKQVAIEVGSFSKLAGFTGVRLGWTVVPSDLKYDDGESVKADWNRLTSTVFNAASNISQQGGYAVLEEKGLQAVNDLTRFYLENAKLLRMAFEKKGHTVFGGINAPYLWVKTKKQSSWEAFHHFLDKYHLVTTPGSGFGASGEGYLRLSAFGQRSHILTAVKRLEENH